VKHAEVLLQIYLSCLRYNLASHKSRFYFTFLSCLNVALFRQMSVLSFYGTYLTCDYHWLPTLTWTVERFWTTDTNYSIQRTQHDFQPKPWRVQLLWICILFQEEPKIVQKFKNNVYVIIFVGVRMPIKRKTKTIEAHCRSINLLQKPNNYCYNPVCKLMWFAWF